MPEGSYTITFSPSAKDLASASHSWNSHHPRRLVSLTVWMAVTGLCFGVVNGTKPALIWVWPLGFLLVEAVMIPWSINRKLRKNPFATDLRTMTFDEAGVHVFVSEGESRHNWSAYDGLWTFRDGFILDHFAGQHCQWVPNSAFASPEEAHRCFEYVRTMVDLEGRPSTEEPPRTGAIPGFG